MTTEADQDYAKWIAFHEPQLNAIELPENLRRKLFQKVSFEDFDIGTTAKIIKDENEETTILMNTKDMGKESEVYLVDHAWSFRFQDALDTLKENPALVERLQRMTEDIEKLDLPKQGNPEEEKKAEPAKTVQQVFLAAIESGGQEFELDNLGISTLRNLPQFPESTEQISFFCNEIENPNDIVEKLVPLPNLRAVWLNGNPVVDTCSNFSMIAELMPKLEILNSQLTNKAGEWAMKFYCKQQSGSDRLDLVERLDLAGKGILNMPSADIFAHMINLRQLDLSDHPEFFMNAVQRAQLQNAQLDGLENRENVTFTETLITIDQVLANLNALEELKCGYQLEEYICKERATKNFLPKLKLLNGIDVSLTEMAERNKWRDAIDVMEKLPLIANVYVMGQGVGSQAVWYLNDEVGSIIHHSDTPNVRVRSFIHSPECSISDPNRLEVSVVWPIEEIKAKYGFYKDNLQGFTEQKGFRSARLHAWFDTPTAYYKTQLELLRSKQPSLDIDQLHQTIQEDSPLKGSIVNDSNEPIKVFTDEPDALATLTDARFQIVTEPDQAQIFWLIGAQRNTHKPQAEEQEGYLNEFPNDDALLLKDLFVPLIHSSYRCFDKETATDSESQSRLKLIDESYMASTQLPAFTGRFYEREDQMLDNVWSVIGGQIPQGAPVLPCLTRNLDWAMRLTEAGPSASIIQKYQRNPMLTAAGHKMCLRYSVYLKGVVPLQAYVSKKVQVLNATKPFTMQEISFGDEGVHLCSVTSPEETYTALADHEDLTSKAVDAIRTVLKAFQVQFGEEIKQAGEEKKRAIYSVDVQFDEAKEHATIQGFSFAPADNLGYSEAFKALFFDEVANLATI